jgi:predicted DNA-binding transcriptional regulator AlpA
MGAPERILFELVALDAEEVGALLGQHRRYVLERLAPLPNFPRPCSLAGQQKRWIAGEILEWRAANRVSPPARRRSSRSRQAGS